MDGRAFAREMVAISKELVRDDGKDVFRDEVERHLDAALLSYKKGDFEDVAFHVGLMEISSRGLYNYSLDRKISVLLNALVKIKGVKAQIGRTLRDFRESDFE